MAETGAIAVEKTDDVRTIEPQKVVQALGHLPVTLSVELGTVRLSLGGMIDILPGARLHVDTGGRQDLPVLLQGRSLLAGALLERERRLAIRLVPNGGET